MIVQEFGIWKIDKDLGIVGQIKEGDDYCIASESLWRMEAYNNYTLWFWPLHLADKAWVNDEVFDDFMLALFFGQDYFKVHRPKDDYSQVSTYQTIHVCRQLIYIREKDKNYHNSPIIEVDKELMLRYRDDISNISFL